MAGKNKEEKETIAEEKEKIQEGRGGRKWKECERGEKRR